MEWAESVSDDLATSVINVSMASDATTTLDAIMRLPLASSLKDKTIHNLSRYRELNLKRGIDPVLEAAVEALPDDQRRQLNW